MTRKFDDIQLGDQLELPAHRGAMIYGGDETKDPDRPIRVAIVTHIWHDPVEAKDYVALAYIRADGSFGKPVEKRTITGLARCGWRKASMDWIARTKAGNESGNVVNLWSREKK
ncbi:MAG: hypothetical protein ACR2RF_32135 [Geminicoccaceae bacterium]